jgi:hypothetical protein
MLIIVDVEKFKADKEFYNLQYCNYIKKGWESHMMYCIKNIMKSRKESTKDKYASWRDKAFMNIDKINEVICNL